MTTIRTSDWVSGIMSVAPPAHHHAEDAERGPAEQKRRAAPRGAPAENRVTGEGVEVEAPREQHRAEEEEPACGSENASCRRRPPGALAQRRNPEQHQGVDEAV